MKFTYKHTKYACYFAYIAGAVGTNLPPLLFATFRREFGVSMSSLAFLITLNFGVQMIVDWFGAKYAERIGYRKCIVAANLFIFAGTAGFGILPSVLPDAYAGLMLASVLYAIGGGLTEVLVSPIVEALPGDEKSSMMSILHSFYCWGYMATVILSTLYFVTIGIENWRWLPVIWSVLPLATAFLFTKVPMNVFGGDGEKLSILGLFKTKIFWAFAILMICSGAAEQSMAQWASLFAETGLHVSKTLGDLFGPCFFAFCMGIARFFYGKLGSKLNLRASLAGSAGLCVAGYLLAALAPNPVINLLGCGICGLSVGIMWPGVLSMAAASCPSGGTALFALLALSGDVGCFTGPETVAQFSEVFTIGGSSLKGGLIMAIVFPLVIIAVITFSGKHMKNPD